LSVYSNKKDSLESLWLVKREAGTQAVQGANLGCKADVEVVRVAVTKPDFSEQDVLAGLQNIIRDRCPYQVLETQKRIMHRNMRKPPELTTRTYVNHLTQVDDQELPLLPPFNPNQGLSEYELKDIIHNGPPSWKNELICQGFNLLLSSLEEFVHFCEIQEATTSTPKTNTNYKDSKKIQKPNQKGLTGKWCEYHKNRLHNTEDCHTRPYQGKNNQNKSKFRSGGYKPQNGNEQNWQHKPTNGNPKLRDIHTMLKKNQEVIKKA